LILLGHVNSYVKVIGQSSRFKKESRKAIIFVSAESTTLRKPLPAGDVDGKQT